jgi:hypothetical protein
VKRAVDECESLKSQLNAANSDKSTTDRKQTTAQTKLLKLQAELKEERTMNELLRADQRQWTDRVGALEQQLGLVKKEKDEVTNLQLFIVSHSPIR